MNTDHLIERLADRLPPVQPLRRPGIRAVVWLGGATLYLGLLTLSMTSGADLAANGAGIQFVIPQLAAIAIGVLAAAAAFASVIPGCPRRVLVWPVVAGLIWVGSLAIGARHEWGQPVAILARPREWMCVAVIVLGGAPLVAVLSRMLRRGAPLDPAATAALGALAVGALANVGACVSHPHASSAVTLVWHGVTITALVGLAAATGRAIFKWEVSRS
jgi:hypothetical protein